MRLRYVTRTRFTYSDATIYANTMKEIKDMKLGERDVIAAVSYMGNQILFLYQFTDLEEGQRVLRSERLRLINATWNPLMLQDYANQVGLKLDNLRSFERYYNDAMRRKKDGE